MVRAALDRTPSSRQSLGLWRRRLRPGFRAGCRAILYYDDYYGPYAYGYDDGYDDYAAGPAYSTSDAAVQYCIERFRSYDIASQTYLGYDGQRHSCP